MITPRLKDIRTPDARERVTAAAVKGVVRVIKSPEFREDSIDGRNASVVGITEPVIAVVPGTFGVKVLWLWRCTSCTTQWIDGVFSLAWASSYGIWPHAEDERQRDHRRA